ncbi:hypothetical protein [Paenibacillus alvei]|uniref:hypothetical protein n=1 Tax=Paenibacillus alvei TaxID=44250 RepID=UPI00227E24C6|nr:hypothetical protein [Paenibacillus alvei]MCY9579286.1 hypothetical protein [Paenibacillus alvei]MCY9585938.1 hypothetical protein [Paenibacillus alvei]
MKLRQLIECTIDISDPVPELASVISSVIGCHPDKQTEILRALDEQIALVLAEIESKDNVEGTEV